MNVAMQGSGDPQADSLSFPRLFTLDGSRFRYLATTVLIAAAYFVAGKLGLTLASVHTNVSAVWPPTGIAIAAVLLLGNRVWPGIMVGAFLANLATGVSIATAGGIATGNTLEALTATFLFHRYAVDQTPLNNNQDFFKFVFFAALGTIISATIGVLSLCLGGVA